MPDLKELHEFPNDIWKALAQERLQMLTQMRDEAHAWHEAYKSEVARTDMLLGILNDANKSLSENGYTQAPEEVKHTIKTPEQISQKRASWPRVKANLEQRFSGSKTPDFEAAEVNEV